LQSATSNLDAIVEEIRAHFVSKNKAREQALPLCREAIRHSANAIRAVHRSEFEAGQELIGKAAGLLREARAALQDHPDIFHAGFVHDSQKEFAEASLTLALVANRPLPTPEELRVERAAYLNGLGEAVGELRRHLLDSLRGGDVEHCEECLTAMDDIYSVLVTFDYPDAMTAGLRRTTDNVRGILERTRGDLTLAVRQRDLERKLAEFEKGLQR
jgi:translin